MYVEGGGAATSAARSGPSEELGSMLSVTYVASGWGINLLGALFVQ